MKLVPSSLVGKLTIQNRSCYRFHSFFFFFFKKLGQHSEFPLVGELGNSLSPPENMAYPPLFCPKNTIFCNFHANVNDFGQYVLSATKGTLVGNPGILSKTSLLNQQRKLLNLLISLKFFEIAKFHT